MLEHRHVRAEIVCAAQKSLNFRYKNTAVERLRDKIIGPEIHRHDDIHIVRRRGYENYRHLRDAANLAAPVIAVKKRQHDIEQNYMRRKLGELVHDIAEITHDMRLEIPSLRLRRNCVGYTRVVLNDKEPVHTAPPKSFH